MIGAECTVNNAEYVERETPHNHIADLLHAMNQPLTALQCSLELSASMQRTQEQYAATVRDALGLTERLRLLVEAMRELTLSRAPEPGDLETFRLSVLLHEVTEELLPIAEHKSIMMQVLGNTDFCICATRASIRTGLFQFVEAALCVAEANSELKILGIPEAEAGCVVFSWRPIGGLEHSPFSKPELGLLLAQHGLEQAGAFVTVANHSRGQSCVLRFPSRATSKSEGGRR